MNVAEFYENVFPQKANSYSKYNKSKIVINIDDKLLKRIIKYLCSIDDENEKEKDFCDIISKPNMDNGKVYESLVYAWLQNAKIGFEKQVFISAEDCLKKNDYIADGKIKNIVFDIKKFGIGFPLYEQFREKLQKEFPDYIIIVIGNKSLNAKDIEEKLLSKSSEWGKRLIATNAERHDYYLLKDASLEIEIRAYKKDCRNVVLSGISEFDCTRWAEENELYFFKHASQFCSKQPFMIICPFISSDFGIVGLNSESTYYFFRYLCRRMFVNLIREKNRRLKDTCDGHAKENISVQTAAQKLSAVMFLDIYKEWEDGKCGCWIYKNPNADNPIPDYVIASNFMLLGAHIDDFKYDNY